MTENTRMETWTRFLFYLCLFNLALIMAAIAGRILFQLQPFNVFKVYSCGALFGLVSSCIGIIATGFALFKKAKPLIRYGLLIFLHGLLPTLAAVVIVGPEGLRAPLIHDITTNIERPPEFVTAQTLRGADENSLDYAGEKIAALQRAAFPDIQSLFSEADPDTSFNRSIEAVERLGWTITDENRTTGQIESYDTTSVFGFIDDVIIRIAAAGNGSRIDVRSVSRVGQGDLGVNAARIRKFMREYNELK